MKHNFNFHQFIFMVLLVLISLPSFSQDAQPRTDDTSPYFESAEVRDAFKDCKKPIWTDDWKDLPQAQPNGVDFKDHEKYYNMKFRRLRNRRALTGDPCTVNKLIGVVGVGSWVKDLGALTDEDLDNYAQVNAVVKAGVTTDPMVSVRDMDNYYSRGTVAGFVIVAGSGSSVLTLDIIKALSIGFYRDGKLQGVKAVREGQDGTLLTLKLIQIPGSSDVCALLTAQSDWLFDEVSLDCSGGVQADVANLYKIKYAFVGSESEFPITISDDKGTGGIDAYNEHFKDENKKIEFGSMKGWNAVLLGLPFPFTSDHAKKMYDSDTTNVTVITPILSVGYQGGAKFMVNNAADPNAEAFEAGMEVGYKYNMAGALALKAGAWVNLLLFDRNGNKVQEETISAQVLGLSLVQASSGTISIKSKVPFSGCEIRFLTVLSVDVGGIGIHYGFVRAAPDVYHHCDIKPTISSNICDSQSSFRLRSNSGVSVTWALDGAWDLDGKNILGSTQVKVTPDGQVTHMSTGKYTFRATARDGCSDETTITVGSFNDGNTPCGSPMVNGKNGVNDSIYALTDKIYQSSGSLLSVSELKNPWNILNKNDSTYAEYISGLNLADNLCIIGIKRVDGKLIYDATDDAVKRAAPKRIGFVVEADVTVLNLHALQFLQIRCYNKGKEVYRHLISENNAIGAGVAGSDKVQKIRYSIEVPATDKDGHQIQMDEFQLWNSGVLNLGGSVLRIYYAFIEEASDDCSSPLACGSLVLSNRNSHTVINADATKFGGTVNVLAIDDNLGYLVDNDLDTYLAIANTVSVGVGQTIAVRMGRTLDYHHQLGVVIDNKTFLAAVKVGSWLTLATYKDGQPTGDEYTDWKVIGAKVAGYGDKNILFFQPKSAYDEIRLTVANIVGLLDVQKFYGLVVRGDVDNDGIPDCKDNCSCTTGVKDIRINQVCMGDDITVTATGNPGAEYYLVFDDKSAGKNGVVDTMSTSATHDNIAYTYTTTTPGEYQLTFYDGSGKPLSSVVYKVHPLQTRWLSTATNNDWNKWDNWSDGSPYCCTNAIISSDSKVFPVLGSVESPADYCCKDIFFEPRSAVENVPSLNYRRAWVELELMPNRYYNLSAPLKHTYTGDMFVPAATKATAAYFEPLTEANWPENRFNPSIYQRLWATTAHGKLAPPDNKGELVDQTLGIMQTRWSRHFNAVAKAYGEGEGFSLWVDNGELPATEALRIRLPKTHGTYHYYNDYDHAILGEEKVVKDDSICRFIYEAENEKNLVQEYSYKQGGAEVKESRTVFVGQEDYYITLRADTLTNAFLMGNPFMSHLDIRKFLEVNDNVKSVVMEVGDDLQQHTVLRANNEIVATGGVTTVEPMQSFYVMLKGEPLKEVRLLLTKEMIGGKRAEKPGTTDTPDSSNDGETKEETAPEGLRVTVECLNSGKKSVALFLGACSTQASQYSPNSMSQAFAPTLLDGEIRPEVKVFGVGSDEAYGASRGDGSVSRGEAFDIMPLADRIPLGILLDRADSISIVVSSTTGADLSSYVLRDNLTGKDYALDSQVVVTNAESSLGRFVLRRIANMPAVADDSFSGVSIMQQGSNVVVQSADANLRSVKVLDMSGRLISKSQDSHARRLQTTGAQGIHIVCIELENGKSRGYKIML
mgnify:FL=1